MKPDWQMQGGPYTANVRSVLKIDDGLDYRAKDFGVDLTLNWPPHRTGVPAV